MLVEKRSKSEFCFPLSHLPPRLSHKTCQSHTHTHTHTSNSEGINGYNSKVLWKGGRGDYITLKHLLQIPLKCFSFPSVYVISMCSPRFFNHLLNPFPHPDCWGSLCHSLWLSSSTCSQLCIYSSSNSAKLSC